MPVTPNTSLLSPKAVGGLNRARVLRSLADHGPLSRSDLARLAGVTRATIGSIIQGLIDDGILEEGLPVEDGNVGKPARPLWFSAGAGTVVSVELRSEGVRAALVDATGTMVADQFVAIADPSSTNEITRAVLRLVNRLSATGAAIGVGIAVPGTTDIASAEVLGSTQVPGVVGTDLARTVARDSGLTTVVENDSRAQAFAEQWFGAGRGRRTFTSVLTGAGLSVGLVLDGTVFRGVGGWAGELGHTTVVLDGEECTCGLRGCWETITTLPWLRRQARAAGIRGASTLDCARLVELAERNEAARALMETYAEHLAIGLANLRHLLGSDYFIMHGDAVGGGEPFRVLIEEAANRRALRELQVVFTELDDRATLLGAGAVVLSELLHVAS